MTAQPQGKFILVAALAVIIAIIGYDVLNAPDKRDAGEKFSDAVNELPNGVDKAARQLKDRTPGEKLSDAVSDENEKIKHATNQQ